MRIKVYIAVCLSAFFPCDATHSAEEAHIDIRLKLNAHHLVTWSLSLQIITCFRSLQNIEFVGVEEKVELHSCQNHWTNNYNLAHRTL